MIGRVDILVAKLNHGHPKQAVRGHLNASYVKIETSLEQKHRHIGSMAAKPLTLAYGKLDDLRLGEAEFVEFGPEAPKELLEHAIFDHLVDLDRGPSRLTFAGNGYSIIIEVTADIAKNIRSFSYNSRILKNGENDRLSTRNQPQMHLSPPFVFLEK